MVYDAFSFTKSYNTWSSRTLWKCKFLRLDLVSHLRFYSAVLACPRDFRDAFEIVPFDLSRLSSLQHLKIQVSDDFRNVAMPCFLKTLLSMSSSTNIESLEIKFTWDNVRHGRETDLFSSEAGWPELDEILTCENFVCLKKITLSIYVWRGWWRMVIMVTNTLKGWRIEIWDPCWLEWYCRRACRARPSG